MFHPFAEQSRAEVCVAVGADFMSEANHEAHADTHTSACRRHK